MADLTEKQKGSVIIILKLVMQQKHTRKHTKITIKEHQKVMEVDC